MGYKNLLLNDHMSRKKMKRKKRRLQLFVKLKKQQSTKAAK